MRTSRRQEERTLEARLNRALMWVLEEKVKSAVIVCSLLIVFDLLQ